MSTKKGNRKLKEQRKYQCDSCGKKYTRSHGLKRHMMTHTGERPFKCHCGKAFTLKTTLQTHMRTHTGQRPYSCRKCGKEFSDQSSARRHAKSAHEDHEGRKLIRQDKSKLHMDLEDILLDNIHDQHMEDADSHEVSSDKRVPVAVAVQNASTGSNAGALSTENKAVRVTKPVSIANVLPIAPASEHSSVAISMQSSADTAKPQVKQDGMPQFSMPSFAFETALPGLFQDIIEPKMDTSSDSLMTSSSEVGSAIDLFALSNAARSGFSNTPSPYRSEESPSLVFTPDSDDLASSPPLSPALEGGRFAEELSWGWGSSVDFLPPPLM